MVKNGSGAIGMEEHVNTYTSNSIVYPNPSTGKIQIVSSEKFKVKIHNVLGEEIKDLQFNGYEIDLSKEAKGIYFLELIGEKNREVKRIVLN